MKILKSLYATAVFVSLFYATTINAAPILSFQNAENDITEQVNVGEQVTFDLWIFGLSAEYLGGFDLDISFDSSKLRFASGNTNPSLDEFDIYEITAGSASVNLYGLSFLLDLSFQAESFRLASFTFESIAAGVSELAFSRTLLSDENALELTPSNKYIANIEASATKVPEPTVLALMLAGVCGVACRRKKHKNLVA